MERLLQHRYSRHSRRGRASARHLLLLSLLSPTLALGDAPFALIELVQAAAQHRAPAAVLSAMAALEGPRLVRCQREARTSSPLAAEAAGPTTMPAAAFAAVQVDLNGDRLADYLVFPTGSCATTYLGAHSVTFWLLVGQRGGRFKLLFSSSADDVELLSTVHHGVRDFTTRYAVETSHYQFDGARGVERTRVTAR